MPNVSQIQKKEKYNFSFKWKDCLIFGITKDRGKKTEHIKYVKNNLENLCWVTNFPTFSLNYIVPSVAKYLTGNCQSFNTLFDVVCLLKIQNISTVHAHGRQTNKHKRCTPNNEIFMFCEVMAAFSTKFCKISNILPFHAGMWTVV